MRRPPTPRPDLEWIVPGGVSPRDPARQDGAMRALDIVLSLAALVFLAPLMVLIAMAVALSDGGPALFVHRRIGRGGRTFGCLKFRSMRPDAEARLRALLAEDPVARVEWARDQKLTRDPRITPLGRFLRRSSLDELPQFLNVLQGEMSLVGPRPIVETEAGRYGRRLEHYCRLRPGITGLWQVSGRSAATYRRRVACDSLYARRRSLTLNARILVSTVPAVLKARGAV
ncbi:sugar transferase [Brevundimonas sp.]|uniref:sugar transferase n=1 Tax=Brevundimonas sp. TaxID=1871086 RepID=UPI0035B3A21D